MNQQSKRAIKALVLELRHTLEDDIAVQLKRYGYAAGRWIEPDKLPHLWNDDAAMAQRQRMDTALAQELRRMGVADPAEATAEQREEAVGWFVREIAYTHLNRLVALKALEVRGLAPEVITTRSDFGNRSRVQNDLRNSHPELGLGPDQGLSEAIRQVCRLVHRDFRLLFDVGDPAEGRATPVNTLIWPTHTALRASITAINDLDKRADNAGLSLWLEDEIIGWLYQFYNAEQKEAIRSRGKPRRPAEVAVINQFFTPRWIVKFLVDNTLGRLWLEMHPDSQRVREKCDYLVPEPQATDEGETEGQGEGEREDALNLDPGSPINNPEAPPRRPAKRPQDLRLIDPACGTMHFGHYAFEVFQEIYTETRERGWVSGADALLNEEVPAAILRHNLYGVDIDLRAVQLAGLSLYIKARSAEAALGLDETRINQVNLVVADAVLPQDGARQQFLDQYGDDKVVQDAVRQVLDEMANVAEVGSLLRVEERLRDILGKAGHAAAQDWVAQQQGELPGLEPEVRQRPLAEAAGAVPEQWGAHYTVARLLEDLRAFAAMALRQHDLNAQLFAQEASKSVHLLDVFLNDYDVVVMNPPYGDVTKGGGDYLSRAFPSTKNDIYAAFFERSLDFLQGGGYVGALTSRTFLTLSSFTSLRQGVLFRGGLPYVVLDLGFGILDGAVVETCASVLRTDKNLSIADTTALFFRLSHSVGEGRQETFKSMCRALRAMKLAPSVFYAPLTDFLQIPSQAIAYWAPKELRAKFTQLPSLAPTRAEVRQGLATAHDERFVRHWWEVKATTKGRGKKWVPFAKGGDYSKYYYDYHLVVNWGNRGQEIKGYKWPSGRQRSRPQNEQFYLREGLTYVYITVKGFNVRLLPPGHIFGHAGNSIFPRGETPLWPLLGLLNSSSTQFLLSLLTDSRKYEVGYVSSIPVPDLTGPGVLGAKAQSAYSLKALWDTGNELCTRFEAPWVVHAHRRRLLSIYADLHPAQPPTTDLQPLLNYVRAVEDAADAHLQALQVEIDEAVYELYEISAEGQALIERELGERPPELVWPQMERKGDTEKREEHVRRLVSWCLLETLKADPDGILTLDEAVAGVRDHLEAEFGEEAAFRLEADIRGMLGRDLVNWLDGPFCKWHTKLYKKTPIVWHLTSDDSARTLNLFLHYHKLDGDTLRKVQTLYLWPARRRQESQRSTAQARDDPAGVEAAELALEALDDFEQRLLSVIRAQVAYQPPDWAEGPFRGGVFDPVLDDGVKVNLLPLQEAGLLRYRKVV